MTRREWLLILRVLIEHNVDVVQYTKVLGSGWVETAHWAHLPNGKVYRASRVPKEALE